MKNRIINYKLNEIDHRITFCEDKEAPDISKDLARLFSDKKMLLIIDRKISNKIIKNLMKDLRQSEFKIILLKLNGSKKNKNLSTLFKIIDKLIDNNFTKKSLILSCGGGVIGDVSALASSIYLRGMIYFHIPTTMTAIVDSCIGGKTGINYRNIINSIGNYYHPRNVFISKNIINLIPKREYNAGFAEVIKSGFIQKNSILNLLKLNKKKLLNRNFKNITKIIKTTLNTKINFFKNDIYENSKRLYLNFGHTFAHAIEMSLKKDGNEIIRHGEAVGIGMLCEIYYSSGKNENFFKLQNLLISYNLPININKFINLKKKQIIKKKIFKNIFLDKKRINKYPRCIKLEKIGKTKIIELRNNDKIFETINNVIFND